MKFTLVTTVKDEGHYLWEWVAYHRLIGFDEIIVFQNDSKDGTHEILATLARHKLITYKYNKAARGRHQVRAYARATRMKEYKEADWVMALDLDEFLVIHCGNKTLPDLIEHMPDFDCAHINWLHFGHSGHLSPPEGLVTQAFTQCADRSRLVNDLEPFKTLFRNASFSRPGIHVPRGAKLPAEELKVVNGSGLTKDEFLQKNFRCTDPSLQRFAQVNHYIVRDASTYILKSAKGSAHQANREIGKKYWKTRNKNTSKNFDLAARAELIKDAMREMDEITGGRLAKLSEIARHRHAAAIKQTLTEDWAAELYDYCVKTA